MTIGPELESRYRGGHVMVWSLVAYSTTITYHPGHVTVSGGVAYVCLQTNKNIAPGSNSAVWVSITTAGATGATGAAGPASFPVHTTAGRGSAVTAGAGGIYYDTTLGKPGFSDGTIWRDAAGTAI